MNNYLAGRIPPQALDMEQAVLGACLLERDALDNIMDIITPEMFYKEGHGAIFRACVSLNEKSSPIDILTIRNQLSTDGLLEMVGGAFYLTELTTKVASAANIEYHAKVIAKKYVARKMINLSSEAASNGYDETSNPYQLIDTLSEELFKVTTGIAEDEGQIVGNVAMEVAQKAIKIANGEMEADNINIGLAALSEIWQMLKGDLVIVASRPAMGKTAFALTLARNAARNMETHIPYFSLEVGADQIATRFLCMETDLNSRRIRLGQLNKDEVEMLVDSSFKVGEIPVKVYDRGGMTLGYFKSRCNKFFRMHGKPPFILIDYIQLMTGDKGGNREQEVSGLSRGLKAYAKNTGVPIIALSQLSRAVENRQDKRPVLSDLRESGAIEQDADCVMFLYRPEYYGLTTYEDGTSTEGIGEVIIAKQRNGPVGEVKLNFIKHRTLWEDLKYNQGLAYGKSVPHDTSEPRPGIPDFDQNKKKGDLPF